MKRYPIYEIFDSIQGEGIWMGTPSTFIRFSGCNLRCNWCDTKYSWDIKKELSIPQIIKKISKRYKTIILTGGEPTLYDLKILISAIRKNFSSISSNSKIKIAIETNGTKKVCNEVDWVVCSPKPDSNYVIKCHPDELKYVVDDNFKIDVIPKRFHYKIPIWLQPNAKNLKESIKKSYKITMKYNYLRLGIQLHRVYSLK